MKTRDFLKKHSACKDGAKWALSISEDMSDVWDAMITGGKHTWLIWTLSRPGVFPSSTLRKLACRLVRETPLKEAKEKWDEDQNYAREIIEIMNTWRDRVDATPLDFAIEAIKNTWRLK